MSDDRQSPNFGKVRKSGIAMVTLITIMWINDFVQGMVVSAGRGQKNGSHPYDVSRSQVLRSC